MNTVHARAVGALTILVAAGCTTAGMGSGMCKNKFGAACTHYTVDRGLAGGAPGAPAIYVAMCHFFFNSVEAFQTAFGPHAREIMADIPNYTDLAPVIQISEVVVA